jgi:hypothetical protein
MCAGDDNVAKPSIADVPQGRAKIRQSETAWQQLIIRHTQAEGVKLRESSCFLVIELFIGSDPICNAAGE